MNDIGLRKKPQKYVPPVIKDDRKIKYYNGDYENNDDRTMNPFADPNKIVDAEEFVIDNDEPIVYYTDFTSDEGIEPELEDFVPDFYIAPDPELDYHPIHLQRSEDGSVVYDEEAIKKAERFSLLEGGISFLSTLMFMAFLFVNTVLSCFAQYETRQFGTNLTLVALLYLAHLSFIFFFVRFMVRSRNNLKLIAELYADRRSDMHYGFSCRLRIQDTFSRRNDTLYFCRLFASVIYHFCMDI